MNSYELSRSWFNFCFDNPEKIKPNHTAVYFFAIEHCNRLGWKEKFGFPSQMVMEAIGIKNWRTYSKTLAELVDFGFIEMIEISKNQYSSNIIAIVKNTKAHTKALDKALSKHVQKQSTKQGQSIVSIDKQYNNRTIEQLNNENKKIVFNFRKSLIEYGFKENLVEDWLKVRKTKKATNTETAFNKFIKEVEKSNENINTILEICISKDWKGFSNEWIKKEEKEKKQTGAEAFKNLVYGSIS